MMYAEVFNGEKKSQQFWKDRATVRIDHFVFNSGIRNLGKTILSARMLLQNSEY